MKDIPVDNMKDQRAAWSAEIVSSIIWAAASYPIRAQADMRMPDMKAVGPLFVGAWREPACCNCTCQ